MKSLKSLVIKWISLLTDIASILSKIGELTLLKRIFPRSKYYVTLETIKELKSAKELGFDYTDIIDVMDVVELDQEILKKSKKSQKIIKNYI
jgi:hypothetical protein